MLESDSRFWSHVAFKIALVKAPSQLLHGRAVGKDSDCFHSFGPNLESTTKAQKDEPFPSKR